MQLFYCPDISKGDSFLPSEESRHAIKVLRKKAGDSLSVVDGIGGLYTVRITEANHKKCCFVILEHFKNYNPLSYRLHIAIAPTKNNDRLEWFLEKSTEIGITEITPILCDHSERKIIKAERLEKVLISAMKQSGQATVPRLNPLCKLKDLQDLNSSVKYIAHCENEKQGHLKKLYEARKSSLILIGPEGDFSANEIDFALKQGYKPISLGNNRLRTETAGIVVCNTINTLEA
ncbi:16S rRNA (uracil(1498)-N(3))-methyltransferase [Flavobacteriales bacterium]|nr:16S rRNA (uracil(1498)-N(3))-methyltransferase [Flavobacteriales bacterium]